MSWRSMLLGGVLTAVLFAGSQPAEGKSLAVVVGIDNYSNVAIPDLEVAVADARRLGSILKSDCQFDTVLELYDNHSEEKQRPERANIDKAIRTALLSAGSNDTVVIYFSGHGFNDANGETFLAPQDCDRAQPDITGYRTVELIDVIRRCKASCKVLILDCCHAGGARTADATSAKIAKAFELVPNLVTLASCGPNQKSQQWIAMGQSVYTFHLLRGLEGAADANHDGAVDTTELQSYLQPRVSQTAQVLNAGPQDCAKFPEKEAEPLVVTRPNGFTNVLRMRMVRVARGQFEMGSRDDEKGNDDERLRSVKVARDFYCGEKEVSQAQFAAVMGRNPSRFFGATQADAAKAADDRPVESVSYVDAVEFCHKLSDSPQEKEAGRIYRLPTEAEWEYACRAGTKTAYSHGKTLSSHQANFDGNKPWGPEAPEGPDRNTTMPVGSFAPNAWQLFDMHGNVWEWCTDWLDEEDKTDRVIRGGGWDSDGKSCRAAFRGGYVPGRGRNDIGFRLVCEFKHDVPDPTRK